MSEKETIINEIFNKLNNIDDINQLKEILDSIPDPINYNDDIFDMCINYLNTININTNIDITRNEFKFLIEKFKNSLVVNSTIFKNNDRDNYISSILIFGPINVVVYFSYRDNHIKTYGQPDFIAINNRRFNRSEIFDTPTLLKNFDVDIIFNRFVDTNLYDLLKIAINLSYEEIEYLKHLDYTKYLLVMLIISALRIENEIYK